MDSTPAISALDKLRVTWTQGNFLAFFDMAIVGDQGKALLGRKVLHFEEDVDLYQHLQSRLERENIFVQVTQYFVDDRRDPITNWAQLTRLRGEERFFLAEFCLQEKASRPIRPTANAKETQRTISNRSSLTPPRQEHTPGYSQQYSPSATTTPGRGHDLDAFGQSGSTPW